MLEDVAVSDQNQEGFLFEGQFILGFLPPPSPKGRPHTLSQTEYLYREHEWNSVPEGPEDISKATVEHEDLPFLSGKKLFILVFALLFLVTAIATIVWYTDDESESVAIIAQEQDSYEEVILEDVEVLSVGEAVPIPVSADAPEEVTEDVQELPAPEPAPSSPTNCRFSEASWPRIGTKYVVRCTEGLFLATKGKNLGGGTFEFSDHEPHR